ncbi:PAS domain-containing protein [Sphingomonas sp. CJ20]
MHSALRFLDHGGEMGRRIRAQDWAATPMGPLDGWPQPLRFALGVALGSSFPMAIYWGPEFRLLYNDAWAPIPAERHPWALGRPGAEVWADIWHLVGPQMEQVMATGQGIAIFDQMLPMVRDGRPQESWWNYSFTPIRDEYGAVVGVLNQGNETTRVVLAERARIAEVERLRDLFQQAPGAVALLHGPDHVFEIANPAYLELVGRRAILGLTVRTALPEVAEQGFVELLDQVYRTGEAFRAAGAPVRLARTAGAEPEVRLVDFVFQPIKTPDGATTDIFVQASDVTERVHAENALRRSEERLQLALSAGAGIGTWDWDSGTGRITGDTRFAKLFGIDHARVERGGTFDAVLPFVHPDDRVRIAAAVSSALVTRAPLSVEMRVTHADGTVRWLLTQGQAIFDAAGNPVRFPGVSFDITERKQSEEAARATAEELREATESQSFIYALAERQRALETPEAVMDYTVAALARQLGADRVGFYRVEGAVIRFGPCAGNGALPVLTGTVDVAGIGAPAQQTYRAGRTLVVPDAAADPDFAQSSIATRTRAAIGVPLLRGGQWVATLFVNEAAPRRWTAEEVAFIEAVAEISWDAVERADALVALRESEEKFRAIANSVDQMIWSTRGDGYHDYFNDRWYEYTGVPYGSTDGDAWRDLFHPDDRARAEALWQRSLETGETYHIEYRLRHHAAGYRWVLGRALPVRDPEGRITRWFGTCTDIQDIVDAREVLARSREELERLVQERTARLMTAEEQLRQAQKMEAVGQLTGGIAHDFNNMLAVVIGGLDLLERRLKQGRTDVDRYVTAARDGATRAAALTQRLLAFSRQQPLAAESVSLNDMIEGMVELLVRTIGEEVTIETRLPAGLPAALADRNQLENVVLNLSVNARDAMPAGGRLTIGTALVTLDADAALPLELAPGEYLEIAVTDTGTGMPPAVAARAFDPFFTTKGVGKGTGLGLSQVFGFARQSNGAVAIDTREGRGTTVRLYLPPHHGAPHRASGSAARPELPRARPGEMVMVVEDEERVRGYSVEALRELGYAVVAARDGPEALRMIERGQRVSLLFSDVVMPEMTGRELAERARAKLPALKVLLTSGYAPEAAGVADESLLAKPFAIDALALRIRAALDG